jgi:threonine/homoserine/homoserine lactone efflux protein
VAHYLSFVVFCAVLAFAPGPDSFLTLRSTVAGGRSRGMWTMAGISLAGAVQGLMAASGLGAVIQHARPVFETIRWAGVIYLLYLGFLALRAAVRGVDGSWDAAPAGSRSRWRAVRSGFLCNITNPKVLAFNLAVLPQFVGAHASLPTLCAYALTLAGVGAVALLCIITAATAARRIVESRRVRRGIEAGTGVVFMGFATVLAADS